MKIFLDSANLNEINIAYETGMIDGITTNPSLASKNQQPFTDVAREILAFVAPDPVSLEVISTNYKEIVAEGEKLSRLADNVVVKVPMLPAGIRAVKELSAQGIATNVTLVFSPAQALLAAKAGATYVSPFVGRLHDTGNGGTSLISEIRKIFNNYNFKTQILVASDRTVMDTVESALIGADVITLKYENFQKLFRHPLTDAGLSKFLEDWKNSEQEALV